MWESVIQLKKRIISLQCTDNSETNVLEYLWNKKKIMLKTGY